MANYHADARSNYFRVKDPYVFRAWADKRPLDVWQREDRFAITPDTGDGDGWPSYRYDDAADDTVYFDVFDELSAHLPDGEVAILMEAGAEKLRYITGFAIAVTATGIVAQVNLVDIYDTLRAAGYTFTAAEY